MASVVWGLSASSLAWPDRFFPFVWPRETSLQALNGELEWLCTMNDVTEFSQRTAGEL